MGKQSQELVQKPGQLLTLLDHQKSQPKPRQESRPNNANSANNASNKCGNCGRSGHTSKLNDRRKNCPAFDKQCSKCQTNGHFVDQCRGGPRATCEDKPQPRSKTKVNEVKGTEPEKDKEPADAQVGTLSGSWMLINGLQEPVEGGSLYDVSDVFTSEQLSGSPDPWATSQLATLSNKKQPGRFATTS